MIRLGRKAVDCLSIVLYGDYGDTSAWFGEPIGVSASLTFLLTSDAPLRLVRVCGEMMNSRLGSCTPPASPAYRYMDFPYYEYRTVSYSTDNNANIQQRLARGECARLLCVLIVPSLQKRTG